MARPPPPPAQMDRRLRRLSTITFVAVLALPVAATAPRPRGPTYGSGMRIGTIVQTPDGPALIDEQAIHTLPYGTPRLGNIVLTLDRAGETVPWLPLLAPMQARWRATFTVAPSGATSVPTGPIVEQIPHWFVSRGRAAAPNVPAEVPDAAFLNGADDVILWKGIAFNAALAAYSLGLLTLITITWRTFRTVVTDQMRITDRRCRVCGYTATGHAAATCPECGEHLEEDAALSQNQSSSPPHPAISVPSPRPPRTPR